MIFAERGIGSRIRSQRKDATGRWGGLPGDLLLFASHMKESRFADAGNEDLQMTGLPFFGSSIRGVSREASHFRNDLTLFG